MATLLELLFPIYLIFWLTPAVNKEFGHSEEEIETRILGVAKCFAGTAIFSSIAYFLIGETQKPHYVSLTRGFLVLFGLNTLLFSPDNLEKQVIYSDRPPHRPGHLYLLAVAASYALLYDVEDVVVDSSELKHSWKCKIKKHHVELFSQFFVVSCCILTLVEAHKHNIAVVIKVLMAWTSLNMINIVLDYHALKKIGGAVRSKIVKEYTFYSQVLIPRIFGFFVSSLAAPFIALGYAIRLLIECVISLLPQPGTVYSEILPKRESQEPLC